MLNAELHEKTVEVLTQLVPVLNCEDLSLLCWHCGVSTNDLMPVADLRPSNDEAFAAFIERITA